MGKQKTAARSNNKKKKNKGHSQHPRTPLAPATNPPNYPNWSEPTNPAPQAASARQQQSHYHLYKRATERLRDGIRTLCPVPMGDKVNDLALAVDEIASAINSNSGEQQKIVVPRSLLSDLVLTIRIRSRVAKKFGDLADEGHSFFISVLIYCWTVLKPLAKDSEPRKKRQQREQETEENAFANRYQTLSIGDDEDDDDDDEEDDNLSEAELRSFVDEPRRRPTEPAATAYSIAQDLIHGSDRFQACLFMETLDELMGFNIEQFQGLKKACRSDGHPVETLMEHLMEVTVSCNAAMQQVKYLEEQLAAENPHLSTFYRVLAILELPQLIAELKEHVLQHSCRASNFPEHAATEFIGDCLEYGFRNPSDPAKQTDRLVRAFCDQWQIDTSFPATYANMVDKLVKVEAPLRCEMAGIQRMISTMMPGQKIEPYSWFRERLPNIGGGRSILCTLRLLQGLSNVNKSKRLELKRGFFGKQWNEENKMAQKIQGDLDEFFMGDVMPFLLEACNVGLVSTKLPREEELLPLFTMIKSFMRNKNTPISVSLVFGIHTLLTGVYEVQGDGDVHELAVETKACFEQFIHQLDHHQASTYPQPPVWKGNLERLGMFKYLFHTGSPRPDAVLEQRAFWNPLVAGMALTYMTYFASLEGGATVIDSFAQLRIVMHLYNAFQQRGVLSEPLPLLIILDKYFANVKALWEGSKPTIGQLVKRWWIAYGVRPDVAQRLAEETKHRIQNMTMGSSAEDIFKTRTGDSTRQLTPINPEDFSKSYQRICLHDFRGVQDKHHTPEERQKAKGTPLYEWAVRTNDMLDSMESEQDLLALNLVSVGGILNEFTYKLFAAMGWKEEIDRVVQSTPDSEKQARRFNGRRVRPGAWEASDENFERYGMMLIFAERLLGALDFDSSVNQEVARAAACYQMFFSQLDSSEVLFFAFEED